MAFHRTLLTLLTLAVSLSLTGCAGPAPEETGPFKVLVSSEAQFLKPVLEKAIRDKGLKPEVTVGSDTIELATSLARLQDAPDALVVTGGGWLPDTAGASLIGPPKTIAWSPVVIGFKPGTVSGVTIPLSQLLTIVTTNPKAVVAAPGDASDASVLFWLGALSAKEGAILHEGDMRKPELDATFDSLLRGIYQVDVATSPQGTQAQSSLDSLKGVIAYEATIQQINQQLKTANKPTLQPTRLKGGTLAGTITLSFVGTSAKKQEIFQSILNALKDASNQKAIQDKGWLTNAPAEVLETPRRGTLWEVRRRFELARRELTVQMSARR
jgi:hypothetical protein